MKKIVMTSLKVIRPIATSIIGGPLPAILYIE